MTWCELWPSLSHQALLFNPAKPFWRGTGSQNADVELMMDCFVSCFRINPHNNQHFKVDWSDELKFAVILWNPVDTAVITLFFCLEGLFGRLLPLHLSLCPGQLVAQNNHQCKCAELLQTNSFVCVCVHLSLTLHHLFQSHLDWWPKIDAVYCYSGELRFMFSDTLNRVLQGIGTHPPLRMTPVRPLLCLTHYSQ